MSAPTYRCPDCHGIVAGSRRVDLQTAIAHHERSCPSVPRLVKS